MSLFLYHSGFNHFQVYKFLIFFFNSSLLCASDNKLKVLRNGKCIRTHSGHGAKITSIVVNPNNEFQVILEADYR